MDHAQDVQLIRDGLGPYYDTCALQAAKSKGITRFAKMSEPTCSGTKKNSAVRQEFPVVFAATGSTLQQVDPLGKHVVRWQLAPVVPRLGNIALEPAAKLVVPRGGYREVCRERLGVTHRSGEL